MRTVNLPGGDVILYGEAPFGWRLSADRSHLVRDSDEQRILSVVRHMYMSERLAMREIVYRLEATKVVNRRGRPLGLSGVWEMIHHRAERPAEAKAPRARKRRKP